VVVVVVAVVVASGIRRHTTYSPPPPYHHHHHHHHHHYYYHQAYENFTAFYPPSPKEKDSNGSIYANFVTLGLFILTVRTFLYECSSMMKSSNFSQWASSVWRWINILSVSSSGRRRRRRRRRRRSK